MGFFCPSGASCGEPKTFAPGHEQAGELLEGVLDTALAAAEMVEQDLLHDTQRRPGRQHRALSTSASLTTP
jgi:hypothetical protein